MVTHQETSTGTMYCNSDNQYEIALHSSWWLFEEQCDGDGDGDMVKWNLVRRFLEDRSSRGEGFRC